MGSVQISTASGWHTSTSASEAEAETEAATARSWPSSLT